MQPILQTAAGNPVNQDRGLIVNDGSRIVLCVADGAGGQSGGAEAASMAVAMIQQKASVLSDADSCAELLSKIDAATANDSIAGETTCALIVVTPEELFGASVGDSGVWLIVKHGGYVDLTKAQQRKPFIGSSAAWPVRFIHKRVAGSLLLATDGLLKYTSAERVMQACRMATADVAVLRLIELVRYPSGALPDDVTVILTDI